MKTAIDFYVRGKQKEAHADDYDRNSYYSSSRFICPECGETVHLTHKKDSNHFSHYKMKDNSPQCDRRVDGVPTDSVYERLGLPLYIRKKADSSQFNLFMGFRPLPSSILEMAEREQVSIKLAGERNYRVNRERFSVNQTFLMPIDYIPPAGQNYYLTIEPANKLTLFKKYWSNYADGFSFQGALFTVTEQGGRKVRRGDVISTDKEYYWVRKQLQLPYCSDGIKMKQVGQLICRTENYYVFQVVFHSNISDNAYNRLSQYLRLELKLHLLEKQPEFVPVWPPLIKKEDGYLVNPNHPDIYGHIVSGNETPKTYLYQGIKEMPDELLNQNNVVKVPNTSTDYVVNIDRKYVSSGTHFIQGNLKIEAYKCDVYITDNEESMLMTGMQKEVSAESVIVDSKLKIEMYLVRENGEIESVEGVTKYKFEKLGTGDSIYLLHKRNLTGIITVNLGSVHEEKIKGQSVREYSIEELFQKYKKNKRVRLPNQLKVQLVHLQKQRGLNKTIESILSVGEIPVPMIKLLEDMTNGRT